MNVWKVDYLIVGAGLAGLVLAERLATLRGKKVLVVDRRPHIGGNCYDEYDQHGVLIHKYGPHYFRTNLPHVRDYLSQFTEWIPTEYRVKSYTDGRFWSFPINLMTFQQMVGREATRGEFESYLQQNKVQIPNPRNSEELIVSQVGWDLYERFFKQYTIKQWRRHPKELDASVCGRIPIRVEPDDRYFSDSFQALPRAGYTAMFNRMVANNPGIHVLLQTDYREIVDHVTWGKMIYTGPIDEYFDCRLGTLPYRSLRFEPEHFSQDQLIARRAISGKDGFWQPELQVNYPNSEDFTRIVELKHATKQTCTGSTIVREYPLDYKPGLEPYYPVPTNESQSLYKQYEELAAQQKNVTFVGRLATYRYYNMDQIVDSALRHFAQLQ